MFSSRKSVQWQFLQGYFQVICAQNPTASVSKRSQWCQNDDLAEPNFFSWKNSCFINFKLLFQLPLKNFQKVISKKHHPSKRLDWKSFRKITFYNNFCSYNSFRSFLFARIFFFFPVFPKSTFQTNRFQNTIFFFKNIKH